MRLSCSCLLSRSTTSAWPLLENFRPTTSGLRIAGSQPRFAAVTAPRFISVRFVSSRPQCSAMDSTNSATTATPTTDSVAPASTSERLGSEVVATRDEATAGVEEKKDLHEKKKKKKKKDDDGVYLPFKIAATVPLSPDTKLFRFQVPADQAQLLRTLPSPGMPPLYRLH